MRVAIRVLGFGDIEAIGLGPTGEAHMEIPEVTSVSQFVASLSLPTSEPAILLNGKVVPQKQRDNRFLANDDEIVIFPAIKGGNQND